MDISKSIEISYSYHFFIEIYRIYIIIKMNTFFGGCYEEE